MVVANGAQNIFAGEPAKRREHFGKLRCVARDDGLPQPTAAECKPPEEEDADDGQQKERGLTITEVEPGATVERSFNLPRGEKKKQKAKKVSKKSGQKPPKLK